jgi:hypothetical protein
MWMWTMFLDELRHFSFTSCGLIGLEDSFLLLSSLPVSKVD